MSCSYSYLQENFYKRFDGAVSIMVVLKESEKKVEGLSPRLRVRVPVKRFFFYYFLCFAFAKKHEMFSDVHVCRKKNIDVSCTCKATSLSKMARLVWRYSDDAGAIIENVYKFCMEVKKSGMKLSLNRVWDRTAPSSASKVSLDDFDHGDVRRTIVSMYSLKKVLPTLDNIRTELKQSIGYTGSKGLLRKDLLHMKSAYMYKRCGVNQKVLMERQDVVFSRIRYLRMVRELREVRYTDETYVHSSYAVPKCWQDSTTGLKIPFSKGT